MDEKLEKIVNELQHNVTIKCARGVEKAKAYQKGYTQGVEDLYKYLRQNGVKIEWK